MENFDIEQFKKEKKTRKVSESTYWNPRKKLLIKQNPPAGKSDLLPDPNRPKRAKAIMQKKAILDRLGR